MRFERLKKIVASLFIATALMFTVGVPGSSDALAQGRRNHGRGWDRQREHPFFVQIRRFDRDRQVRYRTYNSVRSVGYYDRYGRFHAYGYYDRFGRLHRY